MPLDLAACRKKHSYIVIHETKLFAHQFFYILFTTTYRICLYSYIQQVLNPEKRAVKVVQLRNKCIIGLRFVKVSKNMKNEFLQIVI